MLRRVRQEDRGIYTFQFSNSFFTGFQSIDLQIYRKRHLKDPEMGTQPALSQAAGQRSSSVCVECRRFSERRHQ